MNNLYHYNTPGIARGVCWAFVASVRNAVVSEKQSSQTSILPKHLMQECSFELLITKIHEMMPSHESCRTCMKLSWNRHDKHVY